jgi:hypothetical protein
MVGRVEKKDREMHCKENKIDLKTVMCGMLTI